MVLAHTLPQRRDDAIIVSEPSAEVALRVRANRCTPARSRRSAALSDTSSKRTHGRSAFTPTGSEINRASGGPRSGMAPGLGARVVGDQGGAGIPSRRRRRRSRPCGMPELGHQD
jgi:hypothetical protein